MTDVKGLLLLKELNLTNSSGNNTTALVLCDTAGSNSWVSDSLAARLGLQGISLKLTVKCINTEELIDTKVVQLNVTPNKDQDFEAFTERPYVRETLNVGSNIIDLKSMQETYPHLAVLDPVKYSYGNIEMILVRDVYHAIRPLEYFAADEKCSPFVVCLPICWLLSGSLPSSSSLVSTCFKANVEQDYELAIRLSLGMKWNCTARTSRLTHDPQRMLARMKQHLFITAKDTMSVSYGLMTTSSSRLTTFRHWYSSSLSKNGSRETKL